MAFDCKIYCQNCIVCNRAKPDRRGASRLHPLGVPEYPWEIVGIYYVTDLPRSGSHGYASVFIMVYHLTKMAQFVHVIRTSPLRNQVNYLSIIVIDYMVFLKLLCQIETLNLSVNCGQPL